jgi:hypothetical protein
MSTREKIAVVIDFSIRIPDFIECYTTLKKEIITGGEVQTSTENRRDKTNRDFWVNLHTTDPQAAAFYETSFPPKVNVGEGVDYAYRKYFYNNEHRLRFLDEFSYNLFGQGSVTNKADINLINTCQSKLCDVVLIDRTTHTRKVPNTLAFLSRAGIFVKEIMFINKVEEIEELKKEMIGIYDPFTDSKKALPVPTKQGPSEAFLTWFLQVEKKIKNIK